MAPISTRDIWRSDCKFLEHKYWEVPSPPPNVWGRSKGRRKTLDLGPATTCSLFLWLCLAHSRERRNGYYKYKPHFSERFAKSVNAEASIRVMDVALGFKRVPASLYAMVQQSGLKWGTGDKGSPVRYDEIGRAHV